MTAAAFTIFWMRIKLELHSVFFCSFGGLLGMIFGKLDVEYSFPHVFLKNRHTRFLKVLRWWTTSSPLPSRSSASSPSGEKSK